jgi:hypothetical protein
MLSPESHCISVHVLATRDGSMPLKKPLEKITILDVNFTLKYDIVSQYGIVFCAG